MKAVMKMGLWIVMALGMSGAYAADNVVQRTPREFANSQSSRLAEQRAMIIKAAADPRSQLYHHKELCDWFVDGYNESLKFAGISTIVIGGSDQDLSKVESNQPLVADEVCFER